jgi:hypothetical protein
MVASSEALESTDAIDGLDTTNLNRCIDAASEAIERATRVRFLTGNYDALHSGDAALSDVRVRDTLILADPSSLYATFPITGSPTVTEDGEALTVYLVGGSAGVPSFSEGEAALVYARTGRVVRASIDSAGKVTRKAWDSGFMNIQTTWTAGYALADMPEDIVEACIELTWIYAREGFRSGLEGVDAGDVAARFIRMLTPDSKRTIERNRIPRAHRTVEA